MTTGQPRLAQGSSALGALAAPTRQLLFSRLQTSDKPSSVVRRIRAAIFLGLLSDGDKLPREADLARELGVSNFCLREALRVLRDDGLIITRPGKNGGSFVRRPQEPLPLASNELAGLTSVELRDLGDWRQMLTSTAAALAAQRAAHSDIERLSSCAERMVAAQDDEQARRAYARYQVALAAAGQSTRLSRAELSMHEEFDWLVGLILNDPLRRRDSAQALHDITTAIRNREPQAARAAAERHVITIINELARLRLELMAAQHRPVRVAASEAGHQAFAAEIRRFAEQMIQRLRQLAADAAGPLGAGDGPAVIQQQVARSLFSRLAEIGLETHGLGVIAEVGVIPGHAYWMDWWLRTETEGLQPDTHHVMDPSRDDFYDYESRDFIGRPRKNLLPCATGPYIDHGGVDDYLVTMSVPIASQGRFLGVAAADVLVADLERVFAPWLASATGVCLLLNADERVIVSNTVTHKVGDVARASDMLHRTELGIFGWSLATGDSPPSGNPVT